MLCFFVNIDTCTDHIKDGSETDVDCGGSDPCPRCDTGQSCLSASDCESNFPCNGDICSCFSGDQIITLADGTIRSMDELKAGDLIWTLSDDGNTLSLTEVMIISHLERNLTGEL
jgi:hypothetical protein